MKELIIEKSKVENGTLIIDVYMTDSDVGDCTMSDFDISHCVKEGKEHELKVSDDENINHGWIVIDEEHWEYPTSSGTVLDKVGHFFNDTGCELILYLPGMKRIVIRFFPLGYRFLGTSTYTPEKGWECQGIPAQWLIDAGVAVEDLDSSVIFTEETFTYDILSDEVRNRIIKLLENY